MSTGCQSQDSHIDSLPCIKRKTTIEPIMVFAVLLVVDPLEELNAVTERVIYIEAICTFERLVFLDFDSTFD